MFNLNANDMHTLIVTLSWAFGLGAAFYVFRLLAAPYLRRVNGYFDRANEFWHGACMLGMVGCLTPWVLPWPALAWGSLFFAGSLYYLVRAFTFGKGLPFNKQWYDLAHAAMLGGMGWMFVPLLSHWTLPIVWTVYWCWFGGYYVYRLWNDFRNPHWLGFGQDAAHLVMAAVMALMTVWPATFMPYHDHSNHSGHSGHAGHEMHGGHSGHGDVQPNPTEQHQHHQH